jgi:hypothetical protein
MVTPGLPLAAVLWPILSNPATVASCIPGAVITKSGEGDIYQGTMRVKFGRPRGAGARRQRGRSGEFAPDSPLEGDGFEPSVPRARNGSFWWKREDF